MTISTIQLLDIIQEFSQKLNIPIQSFHEIAWEHIDIFCSWQAKHDFRELKQTFKNASIQDLRSSRHDGRFNVHDVRTLANKYRTKPKPNKYRTKPKPNQNCPYYILQIEHGCKDKQIIRKAFLKLAKIYHPDKNTHKNTSDIFKLINKAYQQLKNT